ncbi:MAG: PA0069 family radical SAM protein [Myxococcales bacterium]|nr:PA0069 family radical SAM protein [Myxococcales bacterium]
MALTPIDNPPNPWHATTVEYLGEPPKARPEVFVDHSRRILSRNDSPDIPFRWSVNPYRGCMHACAYCYARPSHEYLGFGAGTDFDRKVVVKPDAPRLLEQAFSRPGWQGELVVFSGNTDCYQPLEATYGLTRACLEVCLAHRNPVGIITKSPLIERDVALLVALARDAWLTVTISVPFIDPVHARIVEPGVPPPARRLQAIERLAAAGVPVGVAVSPVIPGLSDSQVAPVLQAARDAGAQWAHHILVRLPGPVAPVFEGRIRQGFPQRADRIMKRIQETRGGRLNDPRFGHRMRGSGTYADAVSALFERAKRAAGFPAEAPRPPAQSPFRRPEAPEAQLSLAL